MKFHSASGWNDVDLWPAIAPVHACMYLITTPSPYTKEDLLNYKSLDSYQNFTRGRVREVKVKLIDGQGLVGKVSVRHLQW